MKRANAWVVVLVGLAVAGCGSNVIEKTAKNGFQSDPKNPYSFAYWHPTQRDDCKVAVDDMAKSSRYHWSGACRSGFADGCGLLVKEPGTVYRTEFRGCFSLGKKQGLVTETSYVTGKTLVFSNTFDQGIAQGNTNVSESELPPGEAAKQADFDRSVRQAEAARRSSGSIMDVQPVGLGPAPVARTQANVAPPSPVRATQAPSNNSPSLNCEAEVAKIHQDAGARMSSAQTARERAEISYRYQAVPQKRLFEGPCASHPSAREYVATADRLIADAQHTLNSTGNATPTAPRAPVSAGTGGATGGSNDRKVWVGPVTAHCVTYTPLRIDRDTGAQWYRFTNGCPVVVKVWSAPLPSGIFGSLAELKPGSSSDSWFSTKGQYAISRLPYIGCRAKEGDQDVYLDKDVKQCFYYRK